MTFITATLCTAGLAAFAAAVLGGGLYLFAYLPYVNKREGERAAAAAAARAGGLAALGPMVGSRQKRAPDRTSAARRPATPASTHS